MPPVFLKITDRFEHEIIMLRSVPPFVISLSI